MSGSDTTNNFKKNAKPEGKRAGKGAPPPAGEGLGALKTSAKRQKPATAEVDVPPAAKPRTEPLNFRVTVEFRKAFKRAAADQDCKKVELLERIFSDWQSRRRD